MYRKLQIGMCGIVMGCIWFNVYYQSNNVNLKKDEDNDTMELYKDIII